MHGRTGTALIALLLAACGSADENARTTDTGAANEAQDLTPEGPGLAARLFGGGKAMPLQVQQALANGTVIQITSVQAKPTETVLGVKIMNGHKNEVKLNQNDKDTYLTSAGQKFYLSPPVGNEDLAIAPSASLEGELVFLGSVPKEGGSMTLVINEGHNNGEYSNSPGINIPLAVTTAAWSDDGSKKKSAA